jgi:hypothetical protein
MGQGDDIFDICEDVDACGQSSFRFARTPFAHAIKDGFDDNGVVLFGENRYGLDGGQTLSKERSGQLSQIQPHVFSGQTWWVPYLTVSVQVTVKTLIKLYNVWVDS